MSKPTQEQIEVMQHFANGGEVECRSFNNEKYVITYCPTWTWDRVHYRIKEQKKTIAIEKWLMKTGDRKSFFIVAGDKSYIENYNSQVEKVKLLETYKVEL